ncbi:unnamed protein product [Brassica napus]|uniref:(rape) hypothetical protein n=1 Tax=Brassica napus TaxID=3708 RepID=A0A816VSF6_BRANA|nr:unnamed protein product [Brassica napus]
MFSFAFRSPFKEFRAPLCFISHSKAPGRLRYVTLLSPPHLLCRAAGMRGQNDRLRLTAIFIFSAELRGVSQALPSMPARSHFGEARSNSSSGYSPALCFKPVEQEALWYGSLKCCLCASM